VKTSGYFEGSNRGKKGNTLESSGKDRKKTKERREEREGTKFQEDSPEERCQGGKTVKCQGIFESEERKQNHVTL
jgi:hypothetical protein